MLFEPDGCKANATSRREHVAAHLFLADPVSDGRRAGNSRAECLWSNVVIQVRIFSGLMLGKKWADMISGSQYRDNIKFIISILSTALSFFLAHY